MAEFPVVDLAENKPTEERVSVPKELLELEIKTNLLHEAVVAHQASLHQGTHSTKTRAEVRGGGHKPWKQKHTGRARAGSIRSPLWRKGGIIFGPHPRDYSVQLSKRKRVLALAHAMAVKLKNNLVFVKEESFATIKKTRELAVLLKSFNGTRPILIVVSSPNKNLWRAGSNLPNVELTTAESLNTYDLLKAKSCVVTQKAWEKLLMERIVSHV